MVSFLIDAILVLICIGIATYCIKKGFVHSVLTVIAAIASILISIVVTPILSEILYENIVIESITSGIRDTINSLAGSGDSAGIIQMLETKPEVLTTIFERYNVTDTMIGEMLEVAYAGHADVESISRAIASPVASTISNVIAYAICYIASSVILRIVILAIDGIFTFPVLSSANKFGGFILGILAAVIIAFVYSILIVRLVNSLGSLTPEWFGPDKIDGTVLVKFLTSGTLGDFVNKII